MERTVQRLYSQRRVVSVLTCDAWKSTLVILTLISLNSGCRSTNCGWYTSRFGLTRADLTQPFVPQKPATNEIGNTSSQTQPDPNQQVTSQQNQSNEQPSIQLAGFVTPADEAFRIDQPTEFPTATTPSPSPSDSPSTSDVICTPTITYTQPITQQPDATEPKPLTIEKPIAVQFPSGIGGNMPGNMKSFELPKDFPGGDTPPLKLPRMDSGASSKERQSVVDQLFQGLPLPRNLPLPYDSDGRVITLTELQDLALANNPSLQQAIARVEAARGTMIQAGLYPNPTLGYEGDTIGTANTSGYNGGFLTQQFITAGKLSLAQSTAMMEMRAAEYELRTNRIAVATDVRKRYFDILVAQEKIRLYQAIEHLSDDVYQAQRTLVAGGESAVYEPLQLRVLAVMAGNNVLISKNSLSASWRQLASTVGVPELPASRAFGSIDMNVPQIELQQAIDQMLGRNADLNAAQARITSRQFNLRLQQVTPIPDILVYSALQRDSTSSLTPNRTSFNMQVSVPVPVFNRNQGNITNARATLVNADRNYSTVRNQLLSDLADAYNRYVTGQAIVSNYRDVILPDQVRVYRATYERFRIAGQEVDFAQIVVTQQTLAQAVISYLDAVTNQWQATVDVAGLLQVDDLFTMDLNQ